MFVYQIIPIKNFYKKNYKFHFKAVLIVNTLMLISKNCTQK